MFEGIMWDCKKMKQSKNNKKKTKHTDTPQRKRGLLNDRLKVLDWKKQHKGSFCTNLANMIPVSKLIKDALLDANAISSDSAQSLSPAGPAPSNSGAATRSPGTRSPVNRSPEDNDSDMSELSDDVFEPPKKMRYTEKEEQHPPSAENRRFRDSTEGHASAGSFPFGLNSDERHSFKEDVYSKYSIGDHPEWGQILIERPQTREGSSASKKRPYWCERSSDYPAVTGPQVGYFRFPENPAVIDPQARYSRFSDHPQILDPQAGHPRFAEHPAVINPQVGYFRFPEHSAINDPQAAHSRFTEFPAINNPRASHSRFAERIAINDPQFAHSQFTAIPRVNDSHFAHFQFPERTGIDARANHSRCTGRCEVSDLRTENSRFADRSEVSQPRAGHSRYLGPPEVFQPQAGHSRYQDRPEVFQPRAGNSRYRDNPAVREPRAGHSRYPDSYWRHQAVELPREMEHREDRWGLIPLELPNRSAYKGTIDDLIRKKKEVPKVSKQQKKDQVSLERKIIRKKKYNAEVEKYKEYLKTVPICDLFLARQKSQRAVCL